MKQLGGHATGIVGLPVEDCFALLAAVDRYPVWFDAVRDVEVLERNEVGGPVTAWAKLHVNQSPIRKDFELVLSVETERDGVVRLTRLHEDSSDHDQLRLSWSLRGNGETRIDLEFYATVSFLPRVLPLGGVGHLIAGTVLEAATTALAAR
jgi:ribosome-associated toxin RatA of RatAB toxin-antitoxin module